MRPLTCRPRIFAVLAATILFVALATPIWLTAQVEQEHPKDQTNYFVKNLDTLDDTSTLARCISNASPVFADTRPGAPERADTVPPLLHIFGHCEVNNGTHKLTGECIGKPQYECFVGYNPLACPPGHLASKYLSDLICSVPPGVLIDNRRGCVVR